MSVFTLPQISKTDRIRHFCGDLHERGVYLDIDLPCVKFIHRVKPAGQALQSRDSTGASEISIWFSKMTFQTLKWGQDKADEGGRRDIQTEEGRSELVLEEV